MEFEDILYEVRKGVAWITINRPEKMNSFRGQTCDELIKALYRAGYDRRVGAIVLAGAGERAFCTGGDQSAHDSARSGRRWARSIRASAPRSWPAPWARRRRAMWCLCRRYSGAEALAMGLANACVPHDQLDADVQKWGKELCERSPTALDIAKRSFNMDTAHQGGIAGMGMLAIKLSYDTDESREGVKAMKDKRRPDFPK